MDEINKKGGINGRKINPIIANYNPLDAANQRSLCKDWTEGSPAAFAVVDGVGGWAGDNQLCVTQEGKTPLLAQWTTVTDWTRMGSPYLWWLGHRPGGDPADAGPVGSVDRALHRRQQQGRRDRG